MKDLTRTSHTLAAAAAYLPASVALCSVLLFSVLITGCTSVDTPGVPYYCYLEAPPWVNVLITDSEGTLSISVPAESYVAVRGRMTVCKAARTMVASAKKGSVWIDGEDVGYGKITFMAPRDLSIKVGKRRYRGEISVSAMKETLSVVNSVNVEHYVSGVVAGEMPLSWDEDALCAQVVAARTYALHAKSVQPKKKNFDLYADERSQVYIGVTEDKKALHAASATRGVILVWNWKLFPAYYHSACGGRTRKAYPYLSPERAQNIPPLTGRNCPFCRSASTKWCVTMSESDLRKTFGIKGKIEKVEVKQTGDTRTVMLTCSGKTVSIDSHKFRELAGWRTFRSSVFRVSKLRRAWVFEGVGFGHGVGMCQHGAHGMADAGYAWPSILKFYYSGAEPVRVY